MTREQAIEIVKTQYPHDHVMKTALGLLIPELRESEDEKIRKEIIEVLRFVPSSMWEQAKTNYERCFAYLEKQKEHHIPWYDYQKSKEAGYTIVPNEEYEQLIKQKEQKPAEWSEDWREEDIQTRFAFYTYKDEDGVLYLSNVFVEEASRNHGFGTKILIAAEKVAETIGATTISLKVKQDSPANAWYRKNGYGYVTFEDGYDWLEKNLEYMKPNKQEWGEEDDWKRKELIQYLEEKGDYRTFWITWLKSLRPQPSWKPSEEQMKALNAMNCYGELSYQGQQQLLIDLYQQLKKL